MLPAMVTLWGIVTTMQGQGGLRLVTLTNSNLYRFDPGLVNNYSGLLVCRFFIGLLEGMTSTYV